MIRVFLDYLLDNNVPYRITNGYQSIIDNLDDGDSDYDILLKKKDFEHVEEIVEGFCNKTDYKIVQIYHQKVLAKNIFIYDFKNDDILNLDFYGEVSRQNILILKETSVFATHRKLEGISILEPSQEFIQYLVKKVDKGKLSEEVFLYLKELFDREPDQCSEYLVRFFEKESKRLKMAFIEGDFSFPHKNVASLKLDFVNNTRNTRIFTFENGFRILKRIFRPTGFVVSFLGPDGSGKSTIIDGLSRETIPFRRSDYFHLKPFPQKESTKIVSDPQGKVPYSMLISLVKISAFLIQYNMGWLKNVLRLKIQSSLVVFDRYYDDLLVDPKRYRLGVTGFFARFVRYLIPKPNVFFVLTGNAERIHERKKEVTLNELKRQIIEYDSLVDEKRYLHIDVNRPPSDIILEVKQILMNKMHERY
ncbi:hypothetical protein [Maribacter sp. 2-571]|uniref:hypothetical protein n=1 Tax=Maribacter sp. 2-571 TaxID=3417569 RepID=UPI003D33C7A2